MISPAPPEPREPAPMPSPRRRARLLWVAGLVVLLPLLTIIYCWLSAGDRILFEHGVELVAATAPAEVARGDRLTVRLEFAAPRALPKDYAIFVHVESTSGELGACRMNVSRKPERPTTRWAGQVAHEVSTEVPRGCARGGLTIYAGMYDPVSGERLRVLTPVSEDNRVFAGASAVVKRGADSTPVTSSAAEVLFEERLSQVLPWWPWLWGVCLSVALALFLLARLDPAEESARSSLVRALIEPGWQRFALAVPVVLFLLGILVVLEFIKDDAYISFRYAHNLVVGQGLVFNPGERLEGITNFLWVLVLAPFEALGLDLFQVCEVLGSALGIACLALTARFSAWMNGSRRDLLQLWGALWLASSSSFVLYAKSGLEQPLAAFLPLAGAFMLYRARERVQAGESGRIVDRGYLGAGLLLGAGCMTRPELHMLAVLIALPVAVDVIRTRRIGRPELALVAGVLAITVPCHGFRYFYYGTLVPNTFYVKTSAGSVWRQGLNTLRDMFEFNDTGVLAVLAPLAFADRRRLLEKSAFALISVAFMVYYVRVGIDEMHWHRLYIPALPFLCVLAALGVQNVIDMVRARARTIWIGAAATVLAWAGAFWAAGSNFMTTYKAQSGFDGHGDLAGTFHPDLGKFLVRHERPGGLVAFQDMGSTPYHAPDLSFLDFFGLVDGTVAHARHAHGLHTFLAGDEHEQRKYDAEMREYFYARDPAWTILTIYPPRGEEQEARDLFDADPTGGKLGGFYRNNSVQFGLWDDPRFRQRYVPVRTWPRSMGYYLALWRRRDLWDKTPREVVLEAAPAQARRVIARFESGLELLGAEITPETFERHEAFITTWWRLPGPLPSDLTFFVHVTRRGMQIPADHVPGDWMYPADRWKAGQILEDRTLFQLPPMVMGPGTYEVYVGAFRRDSGERLPVLEGSPDGDNRVLIGKFRVKSLWPMLHHLIPPTDVASMRAYPDRIMESRR